MLAGRVFHIGLTRMRYLMLPEPAVRGSSTTLYPGVGSHDARRVELMRRVITSRDTGAEDAVFARLRESPAQAARSGM